MLGENLEEYIYRYIETRRLVFDIGFNLRNQSANITPKIHLVAHNVPEVLLENWF